ncbi:Ser/Thr protein phosphatase [Tritrichomonas foetus]|uniref:Serine/threonine-protein phosphatase n=1 Tax=Tritrichomonas foetus TaxID=1144522 RepID=A0A1J4JSH9_9EUKA|nr:Ser/Thr protein phosphatase [Tritrichomonas foetus]|eukprot:OHT01714.1 Ser/Thr protein phosphatase [Tritrichomonas foetus]
MKFSLNFSRNNGEFISKNYTKNIMQNADSRLDTMIDEIIDINTRHRFSCVNVRWMCTSIMPVFLEEPSLLELDPPVNICGDIHGQLYDLLRVFENGGMPPNATYLFLGDYVDRGDKSVEVICLLFALKLRYPKNIYLLRGNHESPEMTELFGFADECRRKLNGSMWPVFLKVFDTMPIGAVIGNQYFCIHGGLSPHLHSLDDVRNIKRPTPIPEDGLLADLLWSDPNPNTREWGPNDRGATITWGQKIVTKFLADTKLACVVRGHQMAMNGFDFPFAPSRTTVTVFTASKYANEYKNKAAFMAVEDNEGFSFIILPSKIPRLKPISQGNNPESNKEDGNAVTEANPVTAKNTRPPTARRTTNDGVKRRAKK